MGKFEVTTEEIINEKGVKGFNINIKELSFYSLEEAIGIMVAFTQAVKKYIESQAVRLGVKSEEITNRLPKSYSFKDIDLICEDLQEYKFNMSNLPFNTTMINENLKVSAKNVNENNQLISSDDLLTDYDLKLAEALL